MAYRPYSTPPVSGGVTFFGGTPQDKTYNSDPDFIYDGSYLSVPSLKIDNGGTIGSDNYPAAIQISANGTVSIANNLNVAGTLTSINTSSTIVKDPLLHLGSGNTGDINDIGFFGQYNDGANDEYAGLFRDASDANNVFRLFTGLQEEPTTTVNTTGTGYTVGTLVASLSGNADTATKLATARYIQVSDQVTGSGEFDGSANLNIAVDLTPEAIHGQISATEAAADDYILMASGTTGPLFKISKGNLLSNLGGGTMSDFNLLDEAGTVRSITQGTHVQLSGVNGLDVTSAGTGTNLDPFLFSVSYDFSELTATALGSGDTFLVQDSLGGYQKSNITQLGTYLAGDGISVGGDGVLSVDQASTSGVALDAVFDSANFVDTATIDFTVDDVNHAVSGVVKDNSITETKLSRTVSTHTATGPTNLTVGNEDVILVNMDATADTDTVTVTLPNPNTKSGRIITVKRVSNTLGTSDHGTLEITSAAGTIDGASNVNLYYRFEVFRFVSNGSNWFII